MKKPAAAGSVKLPRLYDESTRSNFLVRFMDLADTQASMSSPCTAKTKQATKKEAFPSEGERTSRRRRRSSSSRGGGAAAAGERGASGRVGGGQVRVGG
eukprot:2908666-Pyramimonas_sp.AAC.1